MKLFSYKRIVSFLLALAFLMPFTPSIVNAESENEVQESQVEEIEQTEITSPIVINEIVPDTDNVDGSDGYEFFELQNISNSEINFNNYKVLYNSTDIWTLDNTDIVLNPGELLVVWIKNNGNQSLTIDDFNNYYQSNLVEGVNFTTVQSNGLNNSNQRDLSILTNTNQVLVTARYNHDDVKQVIKNKGINYTLNSQDYFETLISNDLDATPGINNENQVYNQSFIFSSDSNGSIDFNYNETIPFNTSFYLEVSQDISNLILDGKLYLKGNTSEEYKEYPLVISEDKLVVTVESTELSDFTSFNWYVELKDTFGTYTSDEHTTKIENGELDRSTLKPLMITEVLADSDNIDGSDAYEFIEVTNNSDTRVNFKDYKLLYNYPDNGPNDNQEWFTTDEDLFIEPGKSIVFWVKNGKNNYLNENDFNSYYNSSLVLNENLFEIYQGGIGNSGARALKIDSKVGTNYEYVKYNLNGADNTNKNKSIIYMLNTETNESYLVTDSAVPTPGFIDAEYQSEYATVYNPQNLPTYTNNTNDTFDNNDSLTFSLNATADNTDIKRVTLFIKDNISDEFTAYNLLQSENNNFNHVLQSIDLVNKKYYDYYFVFSDGFNEIETETYRTNTTQEEQDDLRFNHDENDILTGKSVVTTTGDNLLFDGKDVTNQLRPAVEKDALFVFDASQTDTFFKNAVAIGTDVIGVFDEGLKSDWKTYSYPVSTSYMIKGEELIIDIHAGNKSNPLVHDSENNDDFVVKNIRLVLPDGRTLSAEGFENKDEVIKMGDNEGKIEILNAKFSIPEVSFNAKAYEFDSTEYEDGNHTFSSSLADSSKDLNLIFDNTGPEITTNIEEGKSYKNLEVEVNIEDTYAEVVSSEIRIDGKKITLPFTISSVEMKAGEHTLDVKAKDSQGNESTKSVTFVIAEENPIILSLSPEDNAVVKGNPTFEISVEDPTNDTLKVDFKKGESYTLNQDNVTTTDGLSNLAGTDNNTEYTDTKNGFPYQVFEVKASDEVDTEGDIRIKWEGKTNNKKTFLYAYNIETETWDKLDAELVSNENGENSLEADIPAAAYISDSKVKVMVQNGEGYTHTQHEAGAEALQPTYDHITTSNAEETPRDQYDFTFAIETDTQYYNEDVETNPLIIGKYQHQLDIHDWLIANTPRMNIQYLFHTGDIIDDNTIIEEWYNADAAYKLLDDAGLPYGILAGNHDVSHQSVDYTNYGTYFGEDRFNDKPFYGGNYSNNRGHYDLISVGGIDFIMIYMGWDVQDEQIEWINDVLAQYPERQAILNFHEYLLATGGLGEQPQRIQNEIVKTNPNVKMVLSGHYHNAQRVELPMDDDGDGQTDRVVQQMLFDYQGLTEGGMGYIRLMHWDNDSQTVTFRTYSPTLDDYNAKDYPNINSENIAGEEEFTVSYSSLGIEPSQKELETDNFTISFDSEEIIGTISDITFNTNTRAANSDTHSFTWEDPTIGTFGWYAEVTDEFGGITKSEMRTLTVEEESTEPDDNNPDNPGDNQGNDNQNPGDNQGNDNQNPGQNQGNDNQKPGDKPNVPGDNGNNQKPGNNQGSNNQKPGGSQNNSNNNTNKPSSNPQTGDDMNVGYVLMAIVLAGGALVFITKLKKSEEK